MNNPITDHQDFEDISSLIENSRAGRENGFGCVRLEENGEITGLGAFEYNGKSFRFCLWRHDRIGDGGVVERTMEQFERIVKNAKRS